MTYIKSIMNSFSAQTTQIERIFADNLYSSFQVCVICVLIGRKNERVKGTSNKQKLVNPFTCPLIHSSPCLLVH
jgi:hypothetical protein